MRRWFSEFKKGIFLSVLGTLLPMVVGCILWNDLPDTIATHWGVDGVADGFGGKVFAVFVLPAILAVLNLLCLLVTAADKKQMRQTKKAMSMIFWIMPLISIAVTCTVYATAMGKTMNVAIVMPLLLCVLFLIMGNYMPKVKQNATLGIKIYWTLYNEENWNKTHRFAGKLWVIGGIVLLLTVLLPLKWCITVLLVETLVIAFLPMAYSYRIYRMHKAQGVEYAAPQKTKNQKRGTVRSAVMVVLISVGVAVLMFTGDITYVFGSDTLRIEASFAGDLELSYGVIDDMELLEEFDVGIRTMGVASARLSMGNFQNEELGNYTLYSYTSCDSMILIRSEDKWLAINGKTVEETQKLYEDLQKALSQ